MNVSIAPLVCLLALLVPAAPPPKSPQPAAPPKSASAAPAANPRVALETSKGQIVIELYADKAPKTVKNFLDYVKAGHYNGTIFHRVIPGFMIQGGGFTPDMTEKPTRPPIKNEADNGLQERARHLAMARTADPNSATAQFFINVANNDFLNLRGKTAEGWGYAVFGKVVEGMDVVDAIVQVPTTTKGPNGTCPSQPIVIQKATVVPPPSRPPSRNNPDARRRQSHGEPDRRSGYEPWDHRPGAVRRGGSQDRRELPPVRQRGVLRRHAVPPRDPELHDPGGRLRRPAAAEADAAADPERGGQRRHQRSAGRSPWRAPTTRTAPRPSSSST